MQKIGFGGSCHWCTEAIFLSVKGVDAVAQGWISSKGDDTSLSEAVIVTFDPRVVSLETLIEIHLHTHSCTSKHSMREKYRSAIYTFAPIQQQESANAIEALQKDFSKPILTKIIPFHAFMLNQDQYLNYYYADPEKPFCKNIVSPKLAKLIKQFPDEINRDQIIQAEKLKK